MPSELTYKPAADDVIDGRYKLRKELGHGGFGFVFLAYDQQMDRQVALKILRSEKIGEDMRARFGREVRMAAKMMHTNIAMVFDHGVHEDCPFMTMEYVDGMSLTEWIRRQHLQTLTSRGPTEASIIEIFDQLLQAIESAHGLNPSVIHRDIKPDNVILVPRTSGDGYTVKVLDFGIARPAGKTDGMTRAGVVTGTPEYMAPEQASGKDDLTPAVDIYQLGCVLYDMMNGEPPFKGGSPFAVGMKQVTDPVPPMKYGWAGGFLEGVALTALEKEPKARFASVSDMRAVIEEGTIEFDGVTRTRQDGGTERGLSLVMDAVPSSGATTFMPAVGSQGGVPSWLRKAVVLAGVALVLLLAAGFAFFAYESFTRNGQPPESAAADRADVPSTIAPDKQAPKVDKDTTPEAGPVPDSPQLKDRVKITARRGATVWKDGKKLGRTDLWVTRAKHGDDPVTFTVKLRRHDDAEVVVDWSEEVVKVTLERTKRDRPAVEKRNGNGVKPVAEKQPDPPKGDEKKADKAVDKAPEKKDPPKDKTPKAFTPPDDSPKDKTPKAFTPPTD